MAISRSVAQYAGKCATCSGRIEEGDPIIWKPGVKRPSHPVCPDLVSEDTVRENVPVNRVWSPYQEAIFEEVVSGDTHLLVEARAGAAKTSSIEEAARRVQASFVNPPSMKYFVFNRANSDEAKERMPAGVDVSTFHSAGNRALQRYLKPQGINCQLVDDKCSKLFREFAVRGKFPDVGANGTWTTYNTKLYQAEADAWSASVKSLVAMGKARAIGVLEADSPESWMDIIKHFDISFLAPKYENELEEGEEAPNPQEKGIAIARAVFLASAEDKWTMDYADMLYLPLRYNCPFDQFDIVFLDEAQDTSPARREIARRSLTPRGRLVPVGDSRQACYGFTGASNDAMEIIAREFPGKTLPLPINYRCSKSVIRKAQVICSDIQAHDGAPEGTVIDVDRINLQDFLPTDAILCRTNAPLVRLTFKFWKHGIKAKLLGRDYGTGLLVIIKQVVGKNRKTISMAELISGLEAYLRKERAYWSERENEAKIQMAEDKVDCILVAMESLSPEEYESPRALEVLRANIENLFTDKEGKGIITLATIHKSKGLEWERVFILEPQLLPAPWVKQAWEAVQEENLSYIAVTRAKTDLRFLPFDSIN